MTGLFTGRGARSALGCTVAALALMAGLPALAGPQTLADPSPATEGLQAPSDVAMVNLVRLLVLRGTISQSDGDALVAQAVAEANGARATPARMSQSQAEAPSAPAAGVIRVPYVPETVRAQIKDELRTEVMAQARTEGWAAPDRAVPDWLANVQIYGDLRVRSASAFYASDNSPDYIDVDEFNSTGPYDFTRQLVPRINTTRDKLNNMQLRGRIGIEATVADRFELGFQLATGDGAGPISTNSTLTGGFRKRDIWLQNAYVKGEVVPGLDVMLGRFNNPLRSTDLMFDPDLAFDGAFADLNIAKVLGHDDFTLALRGGALPIMFEDEDFPSTSPNKRNFRDRYLYTAQLEAGKAFESGLQLSLAGAYHNFTYLRGHVSTPCDVYSVENVECFTDALRPMYATKGNTLMFLRQFDFAFADDPANPSQPQYLGLKFAYRVLDVNASVSVPIKNGVEASLTGNYLYNFGFDPENICAEGIAGQPLNNVEITNPDNALQGACDAKDPARFVGGNEGYGAYLSVGYPALFRANTGAIRQGQWAVNLAYKYLESDAAPDSFVDSDFYLGGTNTQGFVIGGVWAPYDNITLAGRWLSANEIVDAPLKIDVLQIDLGVAF